MLVVGALLLLGTATVRYAMRYPLSPAIVGTRPDNAPPADVELATLARCVEPIVVRDVWIGGDLDDPDLEQIDYRCSTTGPRYVVFINH